MDPDEFHVAVFESAIVVVVVGEGVYGLAGMRC